MKAESATPPSDESPDVLQPSADKPERSRNAKAQARHRAKRKAYIESLEQTVARLQAAVSGTSDHHSRLAELEQENLRLRSENDMLKVQLGFSPLDSARRPSGAAGLHGGYPSAAGDAHLPESHRDLKRRRTSADGTGDPSPSFLGPTPPPHHQDSFRSVPTLAHPPANTPSATSSFGSMNSQQAGHGSGPLYATFHCSSQSSTSSPYSASSLSPLPELASVPRRSFESFQSAERIDPLANLGAALGPQPGVPQTVGPQGYDRRTSESGSFLDNPFAAQVDLDTWRGYTSYARGT